MRRSLAFAILLLGFGATLSGEARATTDEERRAALQGLYRLLMQQEICEFAVSDKQSDALEKGTGALEEALKMSEADVTKSYAEVEALMKKQPAKALCDPNGDAVKAYDKAMADVGK